MSRSTFREISQFMNPNDPPMSMRELWNEHRHVDTNKPPSLSVLLNRHKNSITKEARFLSYNTMLLYGPLGFGTKPVIPYRAYFIGQEIKRSKYDLAALTEVYEPETANLIRSKSKMRNVVVGPKAAGFDISSGLSVFSNLKINRKPKKHVYQKTGGLLVMDSWSQKGVLYTEIDVEVGKIDLYTTHLIYGTTFPGDNKVSEFTRTIYRIIQISELVEFFIRTHKKENVAIITGDFNIDADNDYDFYIPHYDSFWDQNNRYIKKRILDFLKIIGVENPKEFWMNLPDMYQGKKLSIDPYDEMSKLFFEIQLKDGSNTSFNDLWLSKGSNNGATNNPYEKCLNRNGEFCDDTDDSQNGRIDYIWIEKANESHTFNLDTTVVRRRPFPLPNLNKEEIYKIISEVGFHRSLKSEIYKRAQDVANEMTFYEEHPVGRALAVVIKTLSRDDKILKKRHLNRLYEKIDFTQLFNNYLKRECSIHKRDKIGHLSDHIGLDTILMASPKER